MMYIYGTWLDWFGLFIGVPLALGLAFLAGWWSGTLAENWRLCRIHDEQMRNVLESRNEAWRRLGVDKMPPGVLHFSNDTRKDHDTLRP